MTTTTTKKSGKQIPLKANKDIEIETKPPTTTKAPEVTKKEKDQTAIDAAKAKKEQERKDAKAKKDEERAAAKKLRDEHRVAKKANKPVREKPAHMAKVDSFRATLPPASKDVNAILESAKSLSTGDLNILTAYIGCEARSRQTAGATTAKLNVGDRVRIVSGRETRFIGKEGVITKCQRIRTFVNVPGFTKPIYLYNSDVEVLEAASKTIDLTEDETETDAAVNG